MWLVVRHQKIMSMLDAQHRVSTDTLAEELDVSRETVRRDLLELESAGRIKRVHGGAILPHPAPEEPFKERMNRNLREKQAIAKRAVSLFKPGQCVFVDAGTTTSVFAKELVKVPDITVVTNSIDIISTIRHSDHKLDVVLLGGRVISDVPGTYGELTMSEMMRFKADVAVMSPVALDSVNGAANFDLHEAEIARAMIAQSEELMILADSTKIGTTSRIQYCSSDQIDTLVTSSNVSQDEITAFTQNGVKTVITVS